MGLFDKFRKDDHISFLKKNINDKMSLSEIVDVFEKMCARPIDNDMLLFETGTFEFSSSAEIEKINIFMDET